MITKQLNKINVDEISSDQIILVSSLVSKINSSAKELLNKAITEGRLRYCYIFDGNNNTGVMTAIEDTKYFSVQVSFEKDVNSFSELEQIHEVINNLIKIRGNKDLYLNIYGYNTIIINYFRNYGFVQSSSGFGYEFLLMKSEQKINEIKNYILDEDLDIKGFEDKYSRVYLDLLENAFREQSLQCNESTEISDDFSNYLKEISQQDEFAALWKGNELIGLYILEGSYIQNIAIDPKYKGMGYGDKLLKYCIKNLFIDRKYDECSLCTYKINYRAQKLYLRNGFIVSSFYSENEYVGA